MRKPPIVFAVCLICFAAASTVVGQTNETVDRVSLWRIVNQLQIDARVHRLEMSRWWHLEGNESKLPEDHEKETGKRAPDATKALDAALKIVQANPTDDLGYLSLRFCLTHMSMVDKPDDYIFRVLKVYEQHYITDKRLTHDLLFLARTAARDSDGDVRDAKLALVQKVVDSNPTGSPLRLKASYFSASERAGWVNDLSISDEERNSIRDELVSLAKISVSEGEGHELFGQPAQKKASQLVHSLENLSVGGSLPNVEVHVVGGGLDELKNYRGKVVIVDFWATWCVPCVASLPKVAKLRKELEGKPFEVIAVSVDDSDEQVQDFMKKCELPFVNWRIEIGSGLYNEWMLQGVPTYFLIDENGTIQGRGNDFGSLSKRAKELVSEMDE